MFEEYLSGMDDEAHRARMKEVVEWVKLKFPELEPKYAWNQPMFTDHGTFIIGFSTAKQHIAVSPERKGMERFCGAIAETGYGQSKMLFRIKWNEPVDYALMEKIIQFNRMEKAECRTFWRK